MKFRNGLEKSSRSKADLFEILMAKSIADSFSIKKNFDRDINKLRKSVAKFENGKFRAEEQEGRVNIASDKLIKFLKKEKINSIKDVEWVGRHHQKENTLSDVDLTLDTGITIGISLKSTRVGLGTQKNLGYKSLKKHLSLDIDKKIEEMWEGIRLELKRKGGYLESLSSGSRTVIRNKKRSHPIIEKLGKKYGYPVQLESVRQSVNKFNNLSQNKKSNFVRLIFGLKEEKRKVLNLVAQKNKVEIYWNDVFNSVLTGENLRAKKIRDVSYGIYYKNEFILRLQANFTNGIGISAYCQRAFLI